MKTLTWVDITRKSIKSKLGFGWSVQGIEKQNKVKTKVVYRFSTGQRTTVLTDLDWHAENLRFEKVREKLNDRQELVWTFIKQRDEKNKGMFTTSQDLVENLKSEFDGDKTKALSTLNQLENKKLIYSKYRNFEGKGKCRIFYPNKK